MWFARRGCEECLSSKGMVNRCLFRNALWLEQHGCGMQHARTSERETATLEIGVFLGPEERVAGPRDELV